MSPLTGVSEGEIAERVLAELRTAVQLRKVSDVPVGVFLSGGHRFEHERRAVLGRRIAPGQDLLHRLQGEYQSYRNELDWARRMANEVGAEHHELLLTQDDLLDFLPRMVQLQDEPIADPVCVPVYYVSKLARDNGVIVAQVGEGADELFCGYPSWMRALQLQRADRWPVPRPVKAAGLAVASATGRADEHARTSGCAAALRASRCSGVGPRRSRSGRRCVCSAHGCASSSGGGHRGRPWRRSGSGSSRAHGSDRTSTG